ncbi:MAG: GNAT family N-acetyltransferase [Fibromonadaceae bacterium]|jgi:ribosomal protein S18 acetylase RimI-like enzyme|nr:GNAT family N-acetyltransferase [Fibromonadaceae bacterium]
MVIEIEKATFEDLPKILDLQKLAYMGEANLLNYYTIQPLTQTLEELENEFKKHTILKLVDKENNVIIGSIRAREENGRVYVGRLFVHPKHQKKGFGTNLLKAIEELYQGKTFELFTSSKSEKNLKLYIKNGYKEYKRQKVSGGLEFVFMEK